MGRNSTKSATRPVAAANSFAPIYKFTTILDEMEKINQNDFPDNRFNSFDNYLNNAEKKEFKKYVFDYLDELDLNSNDKLRYLAQYMPDETKFAFKYLADRASSRIYFDIIEPNNLYHDKIYKPIFSKNKTLPDLKKNRIYGTPLLGYKVPNTDWYTFANWDTLENYEKYVQKQYPTLTKYEFTPQLFAKNVFINEPNRRVESIPKTINKTSEKMKIFKKMVLELEKNGSPLEYAYKNWDNYKKKNDLFYYNELPENVKINASPYDWEQE